MNTNHNDYVSDEFEDQGLNLRDYFRILNKRKFLILTVLGLVFLASIVKTYTTTPIFTATSQVLIERNYGSKGLENQFYRYEPEFLETQTEIIKSPNVARKVVDKLQLTSRYRHYFFSEPEKPSFISALRTSIGSFIRSAIASISGEAESVKGEKTSLFEAVAVEKKSEEEIVASRIQGGLRVLPVNNTKIVRISYNDRDPAISQLVANAVVQAYMDEMLEIKLSTSSYSVKWMTDKAEEERAKLEHSERELQLFMRENDLVTVEDKMTLLPQRLSEFGRQISMSETEKKELQGLINQIRTAGNNLEKLEEIPNLSTNEVLKSIRERIYKASQNIQELSKKYGPKHPKMIKANDELRILNNEKRFEVERIISSITNSYELATSKEQNLKELLAGTKSEMMGLNEKFMQYQVMKREVDSNRVMYETLQSGIKQEGVTGQSQSVNIWVMKKADLPVAPSKPDKQRNLLIGLILGLLGGVGLALLIEYLDNTVQGAQELEEKYGLTVLGTIRELNEKGESIDSYISRNPLSPFAESYRLIRTGLLLSSAEHPPRSILVTSMDAKEGKTSNTANIARILTLSGSRVLVIDCDLRRPRMHEVFGAVSEVGLSSFLSGSTEENVIQKSVADKIDLLPSGPIPPSPAELLSSNRMKLLVEKMAEEYDFVLLDSPPVQSVTDGLALSQIVDGTIVVVRAGRTTHEMLESGMRKLQGVQAKVLGFVLNGMKGVDTGRYYYGYSNYYARDEKQD